MRRVDYHALYPCTVAAQDGQTLEVVPDDAKIAGFGLSSVPLKPGLPGTEIDVPEGARVLLGFEGGDPQRPYAALWEATTDFTEIRLDSGSEDIARTTDSIESGFMLWDATATLLYYAPAIDVGGTLIPGVYTAVTASPTPGTPPSPGTLPATQLTGTITSGNSKIKA